MREGVSLLKEQMTFTDPAANTNDVEDNYQVNVGMFVPTVIYIYTVVI